MVTKPTLAINQTYKSYLRLGLSAEPDDFDCPCQTQLPDITCDIEFEQNRCRARDIALEKTGELIGGHLKITSFRELAR
jgi:hypothetical protein